MAGLGRLLERFRRPPAPFVVGAGRSGNTLLRMMLDAHPEMAIPPETVFWVAALERAAGAADPAAAFVSAATEDWRWTDTHVDAGAWSAAVRALPRFTPAGAMRAFYGLYAARFGKRRWGDKTPFYLRHMTMLAAVLPEARFVHIVRDGRDAALSIVPLWFGPNSVEEAASDWRDTVLEARRQGARLAHYFEVRYEDLVREPEATLRRVCAAVRLDYDPAMLRYAERAPERVREVVREFRDPGGRLIADVTQRHAIHANLARPPLPERIGGWREAFTPAQREHWRRVAGDLLRELGHDLG
jgi:hypothetical protein